MRRDGLRTKQDSETSEYTFHFQITNGGGRTACSVRLQAPNHNDATNSFRENWPTIELRARESLAQASDGTGISLLMP